MTKPISKAKLKEIVSAVYDTGRNRRDLHADFSQADYVAGAMAAMQAMGVSMSDMPAAWIMGNMAGMDIFGSRPCEKCGHPDWHWNGCANNPGTLGKSPVIIHIQGRHGDKRK